jgi:malate permease and related proteins
MSPQLLLVVGALAAGYLARRLGRFPDNASEVLNRFVIDVCLPATILLVVPSLQLRWDLLLLALTPWLLALIAFALARGAARLLPLDRPAAAALLLCTAIGNTSFLGYPLCVALLGEAALPLAAVYDQLGTFLILCSVAPLVLARARGQRQSGAAETLRGVLSFPPFVALLLALVPWPAWPFWLSEVLSAVSRALVPVAMFAVGLKLRITLPAQRGAFALGLLTKLVLLPLCALGVCTLTSASPEVRALVVLESAMPASITAGALAIGAGCAPELAAALVGWGIPLALFSVPAWAALLR